MPRLEMFPLSSLRKFVTADKDKLRAIEPSHQVWLAKQIKFFGILRPLVLNETTGELIDGNRMVPALEQILKPEEMVPVWLVQVEANHHRAAHLALNSHASEWIWVRVSEFLRRYKEQWNDLSMTGFLEEDIEPLLAADWKPCAVEGPAPKDESQFELF